MKKITVNATVNQSGAGAGAGASASALLPIPAARFAQVIFRVPTEPATATAPATDTAPATATTTKAEVDTAAAIPPAKVTCRAELGCDGGLVSEADPQPAIIDRTTITRARQGRSGSRPGRMKHTPFSLLYSGATPASRLRKGELETGPPRIGALNVPISGETLRRTVSASR